MGKVIELKTNGVVKTNDDREFTRLIGGFGEDKPMFLVWQAGELLGLRTGDIRANFENNEDEFELGIDFIDLKLANDENVSNKTIDITSFLKNNGYSQSKLNATKRWLAFSFSGMMKLVKIATTKESWEIYDRFLEDYFQTKAENHELKKELKQTLEEQLEVLQKHKKFILGSMFMEQDNNKKMELFNESEKLTIEISKIEQQLERRKTIEDLQPKIHIANTILDTQSAYDVGSFAKILGIDDMGRNNMFKWMRGQGLLMKGNEPYQKYMKYFKVIPVVNAQGYTNNKTLLNPKGVEYIVKRLIDDGKAVTKSVDEILEELEKSA